ncbi:MAG: hypothetical protein EBR34_08175 [Sphingomonadaceae bacterium]|nr:hypothetical protein [Sphingomonadaceae bacterium]
MKRRLSLMLLLGALLGLLGQETAFARMMPVEQAVQSVAAPEMSADCAEMMRLAQPNPQPDKQPCEGMTPDCIAKMGCAVSVAVIPTATVAPPIQIHASPPPQSPVARLVGRNTGPEPDPPTRLG